MVAINLLGTHLDALQLKKSIDVIGDIFQTSAITKGIIERSYTDNNTPIDGDLNYVDHDRFIVKALSAVAKKKKHAVQKDNYTLAKTLKELQGRFTVSSNKAMELLSRKHAAIKIEDFDAAAECQVDFCFNIYLGSNRRN